MTITELIGRLSAIKHIYGDLQIVGGHMRDDMPLNNVLVVDVEGCEVHPHDPNGVTGRYDVAGVFMNG